MASTQIGGSISQRLAVIGQGNVKTLHVGDRDRALGATLLESLGRGNEDIVLIIGSDKAVRRIGGIATSSMHETGSKALASMRGGVLDLRRSRQRQGIEANAFNIVSH